MFIMACSTKIIHTVKRLKKKIIKNTFIMTTDNVRKSKTVSSYMTNVGKT